jgi:hypothetical protein
MKWIAYIIEGLVVLFLLGMAVRSYFPLPKKRTPTRTIKSFPIVKSAGRRRLWPFGRDEP